MSVNVDRGEVDWNTHGGAEGGSDLHVRGPGAELLLAACIQIRGKDPKGRSRPLSQFSKGDGGVKALRSQHSRNQPIDVLSSIEAEGVHEAEDILRREASYEAEVEGGHRLPEF